MSVEQRDYSLPSTQWRPVRGTPQLTLEDQAVLERAFQKSAQGRQQASAIELLQASYTSSASEVAFRHTALAAPPKSARARTPRSTGRGSPRSLKISTNPPRSARSSATPTGRILEQRSYDYELGHMPPPAQHLQQLPAFPVGNPGRMGASRLRGEVRDAAAQHAIRTSGRASPPFAGPLPPQALSHATVTQLSYDMSDLFQPDRLVERTAGLQAAGRISELVPTQLVRSAVPGTAQRQQPAAEAAEAAEVVLVEDIIMIQGAVGQRSINVNYYEIHGVFES